MRRTIANIGTVLAVLSGVPVSAEIVPKRPAELSKDASRIITAKVHEITVKEVVKGDFTQQHYVARVRVEKVEKGFNIKAGDFITVGYWRQSRTDGKVFIGTGGHRGLPVQGETLRIYLIVPDGRSTPSEVDATFHVVFPNGFEKLKP